MEAVLTFLFKQGSEITDRDFILGIKRIHQLSIKTLTLQISFTV